MDEAILRSVNALSSSDLWLWLGVAASSRWMLLAICGPVAVFLLATRRFFPILVIAVSMGASDLINARLLKPLIGRERPCRALTNLELRVSCGPGRSFPSGHAAVSFAFLTSAAPVVPYGWLLFAPVASAVAGSRVLLGVHYPSDVVGGALLGVFVGSFGNFLRRRYEKSQAAKVRKGQAASGKG